MVRFVKCPSCGEEIAWGTDQVNKFDCPACDKIIDIGTAGATGPLPPSVLRKSTLNDGTVVLHIGSCPGTTAAVTHVETLLTAHGIWVGMEGSKAYSIFVREADAGRARTLLSNDPQKDLFHISVYPANQPASQTAAMNHDYETVGEFTPDHRSGDTMGASLKELSDLLEGAGIVEFGLDGSRAYRIIVRRDQADTAREVLRRSNLKNGGVVQVF